ncbi:F0F1 ATP synthase subunit B [Allostreptomyces psammosilenae]|uniref:ATP synthase subunit b n=1 Tax=Allostreptomyces psammosilenae TaxID=1892865 RepID=A0A852ZXG0_9ACTN|nr:F0F1 ATP synthase subunit B [Allostreptomyces psammosilenae]NYI06427.1 F-type H+-transporting ATPase subunit b [Allostreptomyces psammosilenae]
MDATMILAAAEEGHHEESNVPEGIEILLPAGPDLFWGAVCFVILFVVFWRYVLPIANKALAARTDAIEGGIKRAEEAQVEAQRTLEEYRAQLADARHEAARLRQEGQEQGAAIIAQMREEGQRQREAIIAAGHAQIEADRKQATAVLRQDVGRLATELASRIVGESLEESARASRVIDRFLDELEERAEAEGVAP